MLPLHLFEQQSPLALQEVPTGKHEVVQEGYSLQSLSLQSTSRSQSLSALSLQLDSEDGGAPQSNEQEHDVSPGSHILLPQHEGVAGMSVQEKPFEVQID